MTVAAAVTFAGLYLARVPILRQIGAILVYADPVVPVDVIIVTLDSGGAGTLEAADLVRLGVASKVAVFSDPPRDADDFEFIRRGLAYDDRSARQVNQLALLGVHGVLIIASPISGTTDEVLAIPNWCIDNGLRSAIVVATTDHSRRLHRALSRSSSGQPTKLWIRPSGYSAFDPNHWWESRNGIRIELIELQKLLLDVIAHPTQE